LGKDMVKEHTFSLMEKCITVNGRMVTLGILLDTAKTENS
jgi:hypothetical protein